MAMAEAAYRVDEICDVAVHDQRYGDMQQQYVVKGFKVTLYKHACIKMIDQITDQPCNAVIPTDY
mgnify:CR=1 FL=1